MYVNVYQRVKLLGGTLQKQLKLQTWHRDFCIKCTFIVFLWQRLDLLWIYHDLSALLNIDCKDLLVGFSPYIMDLGVYLTFNGKHILKHQLILINISIYIYNIYMYIYIYIYTIWVSFIGSEYKNDFGISSDKNDFDFFHHICCCFGNIFFNLFSHSSPPRPPGERTIGDTTTSSVRRASGKPVVEVMVIWISPMKSIDRSAINHSHWS